MRLKLNRPICFFDLETTGAKVGKDRIVEIAILRVDIDKTESQKVGELIQRWKSLIKLSRSME
jgi:DNA polymerase III epsilon subunit-like protein